MEVKMWVIMRCFLQAAYVSGMWTENMFMISIRHHNLHSHKLHVESTISFLSEACFGLRVLSLPASACVSVHRSHVLNICLCQSRARRRDSSSPPSRTNNLDRECKTPLLRSYGFCGAIDLNFKGQFCIEMKFYRFWAIPSNHHLFKLGFPNSDKKNAS